MLVLFETAGGFAIFKLLDKNKIVESSNLYRDFETPEAASKIVKLKYFEKFEDTTEALASTTALIEGKLPKLLKKMLKKYCPDIKEEIAVSDHKLGNAIKEKLNLQCVYNTSVQELMRCIRSQLESLLIQLPNKEMVAMALGLAHSLSRYKLKFSPDKIDTMVIQAIKLVDDIDKEKNNYYMRLREWYGWHFPELGKIVTDNEQYVKIVKLMGARENAVNCDMSDILMEHVEKELKEAAEMSMGTEIATEDISNIQALCDEIIDLSEYRKHLYEYLTTRMMALAPNLTILVGELVGARLISHAGSLVSLAKYPASTVQILGAEKALFRALKTKKDTPKYGLIYHAQLIGQATTKNKGKMSRKLAAKASLSIRVDALGETTTSELGVTHKAMLERELQRLNEGNNHKISGTGRAQAIFEKYHKENEKMQYPTAADSTLTVSSANKRLMQESLTEENEGESKKKKKKIKQELSETVEPVKIENEGESKKKKKKIKQELSETVEPVKIEKVETVWPVKIEKVETVETVSAAIETSSGTSQELTKKKKKKKRQREEETMPETPASTEEVVQIVKKKRKREEQIVSETISTEEVTPIEKKKRKKEKIEEEIVSETIPSIEKKKKKKKKAQDD